MIKVQLSHPITHRLITRYFNTRPGMDKFIRHFCCPMSYYFEDEDYESGVFGYYDPFEDSFLEDYDE